MWPHSSQCHTGSTQRGQVQLKAGQGCGQWTGGVQGVPRWAKGKLGARGRGPSSCFLAPWQSRPCPNRAPIPALSSQRVCEASPQAPQPTAHLRVRVSACPPGSWSWSDSTAWGQPEANGAFAGQPAAAACGRLQWLLCGLGSGPGRALGSGQPGPLSGWYQAASLALASGSSVGILHPQGPASPTLVESGTLVQ